LAKPNKIITTGADSYAPKKTGESVNFDPSSILSQPDLPEVAPPSGSSSGATMATAMFPVTAADPNAPDVLKLIQGAKFETPFVVTLMRKVGHQIFKSDAGQKTEDRFEPVKELIKDPSDLLRLSAAIKVGVYKSLNDMSLEFQFMLYLAAQYGVLKS
jgi:hypothetical protein